MFEKAFSFDDICLVPQYNNIMSRTTPSLETWLTKNSKVMQPLIPANMDTVISEELADVLIKNGSLPIFHRFANIETQLEWVKKYGNNCFVSCGVNNIDQLKPLFDAGARGVCIDIAHGHSLTTIDLIKQIKTNYPDKEVIAGNVCTPMGYSDLVNAGADCVKVGIGPGAACTTRVVTGFGVPQFSAIYNIAKVAKKLQVPIIADGGIRNSRDVVLALAAGASTCMIGNLFAKTYESAGQKYINYFDRVDKIEKPVYIDQSVQLPYKNKSYDFILGNTDELPFKYDIISHYRGQASKDFQDDYYGSVKKGTCPEGVSFKTKSSGNAQEFIDNICAGLRSGLTYGGAKSIKELQRKAEFMEVTSNYGAESNHRSENN